MGLNDYLKCPGFEHALVSTPEDYSCPHCRGEVEIWSDEKKARCSGCGKWVQKRHLLSRQEMDRLINSAIRLGAGDANVISSSEIIVEDELASLCNGAHKCDTYGQSLSCPPHVAGPAEFRRWRDNSRVSIVVKIDFPSQMMFFGERRDIMGLLHEIVAGVETVAVDMGYAGSQAFAGGSCKRLFCGDKADCRVLGRGGSCRHPGTARPSMSGFGINVGALVASAGWETDLVGSQPGAEKESLAWVAGLVLVAD